MLAPITQVPPLAKYPPLHRHWSDTSKLELQPNAPGTCVPLQMGVDSAQLEAHAQNAVQSHFVP